MRAENNNDIAITEAKLKDFLSSVLSSEGIVVDIRRTYGCLCDFYYQPDYEQLR